MPNEPTRRIEAELKAYVDERRAEVGPPFELHPVNRRLLQEEVAGTLARGAAQSQPDRFWLKRLWPRLAVAGALGVVGVFVMLQLTPGPTKAKYQMAKAPAPTDAETASPPPPTVSAAPKVWAERDSTDRLATRGAPLADAKAQTGFEAVPESAKPKDAPDSVAPRATAPRAPAVTSSAESMQRRYGLRPSPTREKAESRPAPEPTQASGFEETAAAVKPMQAPVADDSTPMRVASAPETESVPTSALSARASRAAPAAAPLSAQQGTAGAKRESDALTFVNLEQAPLGQRFAQTEAYRRNFNSPPPPPVLRSFQLRQSGVEVEIEDADGSVYRGTLSQAEVQQAVLGETQSQPAQRQAVDLVRQTQELETPKPPTEATWRFVAVGTNLSLNERVVFAGEFVMGTNPPARGGASGNPAARSRLAPTGPAAASALHPTQRPLVPLLRIQGQAAVGEGTKLEINAQPVTR
jgi:hypothetical protein